MKKKIAVLTGAGISAESGLRTFRDSDGLWEGHRVEDVATPEAWHRDPEMVLNFYNERRRNVLAAEPNAAHYLLAKLEQDFDVQIITQNIDDLHERAGSSNVLHLHGEILKRRSVLNDELYFDIYEDMYPDDIAMDGGVYRPHVVWFGEPVPMIMEAVPIMQEADIFILVGTSLVVYPAAGLVDYLPSGIPKYVVDRSLPPLHHIDQVIAIEQPASTGMQLVYDQLTGALRN